MMSQIDDDYQKLNILVNLLALVLVCQIVITTRDFELVVNKPDFIMR